MRKAAVTTHHREVYLCETKTIDELLATYSGDSKWPFFAKGTTVTAPRLSLAALERVWFSLRNNEDLKFNIETADDVLALTGIDLSGSRHPARRETVGGANADTCTKAERYFRGARRQIRGAPFGDHRQISTYINSDGQPLLLRKFYKESTSLTLEDMHWQGVTIPHGAIVDTGLHDMSTVIGSFERQGVVYKTYLTDEPEIYPDRMSPWGYDEPIDRAIFGVNGNEAAIYAENPSFNSQRASLAAELTIQDFRDAAHQVMALCDVAPAPQPAWY